MGFFQHMHMPFQKAALSANTVINLTDEGRNVVYANSETGGNFRILKELEGNGGAMTIVGIGRKVGLNNLDDLKARITDLKHAGYVRFRGEENTIPMEEQC